MNIPKEFKYTKEHEWASIDGKTVTIGITSHAQQALGDVVYVELPSVGRVLKKGETFGVVESIKAVSDLYSPIAGKVIEVNTTLPDEPAVVNHEPYAGGWMIRMELTDSTSAEDLMDASAYQNYVESLK